ncbi:MAG: FG-GAP-like repeat-containing protein, partial [Acidiferrobacterales bacterium]|nr:FG-GAP-like repeat-containing protein [Acidiferrobacterales bacterium]
MIISEPEKSRYLAPSLYAAGTRSFQWGTNMRPETIAPANQFRLKNSLAEKIPVDKLPDQIWEHNPHLAGGPDDGSGSVINPDIDVFVSNYAHFSQTLTNSGDGTFTAGTLSDGSHDSLGVALGDLDGDGDLDAIVTNLYGYNEILINDGFGNFTVR